MYQSHRWQEQIKIETITSLKNMLTTWLAKHDKSVLIIFFKLGGNVYAFDSTTIDLCLSVFWWAKFRKKKGGIKVHTLYDVETQIPAFFHITEASVHDSKVMIEIPYEPSSYYIFDRGYNNFKMLYKIHQIEVYFVVRAKKNLGYKSIQWKRRLPKNVLSDASVLLTGFYPKQYYPEHLDWLNIGMKNKNENLHS